MGTRVRKVIRRSAWSLIAVVLAASVVVAFIFQQEIRDHFDAREYSPTSEMVTVAEHLELTSAGTRIFYATHPTLEEAEPFNLHCRLDDASAEGHLLGCYTGGRIHLFDIDDERVSSVVEATAAHELLHAVYERFSQRDREALSQRLLEWYDEYAEAEPKFAERMSVYEHLSSREFTNELHSIFATEVHDLPDWLEAHYATWFNNRAAIVEFYDRYQATFDEVAASAQQLTQQLEDMREEIEADSDAYAAAVEQYNRDWESFVSRNDNYEFSDNSAEFERLKSDFEERRAQLDSWKRRIDDNIDVYNQLREDLEELGNLSTELSNMVDSTQPLVPQEQE